MCVCVKRVDVGKPEMETAFGITAWPNETSVSQTKHIVPRCASAAVIITGASIPRKQEELFLLALRLLVSSCSSRFYLYITLR